MPTLSPAQIYALATGAGLSPAAATTATAVALAESGGRTDAVGDVALENSTWGPSVGLWQIRSLKAQRGTGGPRDETRLTDPTFNAASMASISGTGGNFKPWTTYTKGTYKSHLSQVSPAAAAGGAVAGVLTSIAGAARGSTSPGGSSGSTSPGGSTTSTTSTAAQMGGISGDVFTIAVKTAGAAAAIALVVVGLLHTVK
jgi:hypothetical protein